MADRPEPVDLIERAFALARQSGKSEWWAMTIPVLKNRLLLLTKNKFKEADYGASTFREFLGDVPGIIKVDETLSPGLVILKSAAPDNWDETSTKKFRGQRVRPDLWRAVLDYSSGRKYVWDTSRQAARIANSDEDTLVLPTISASDLENWRAEFVASHKSVDPALFELVEKWENGRLPTIGLPAEVRPIWNKYLKRKVQQRLQDWFKSNPVEVPTIIEDGQDPGAADKRLKELREFIAD